MSFHSMETMIVVAYIGSLWFLCCGEGIRWFGSILVLLVWKIFSVIDTRIRRAGNPPALGHPWPRMPTRAPPFFPVAPALARKAHQSAPSPHRSPAAACPAQQAVPQPGTPIRPAAARPHRSPLQSAPERPLHRRPGAQSAPERPPWWSSAPARKARQGVLSTGPPL